MKQSFFLIPVLLLAAPAFAGNASKVEDLIMAHNKLCTNIILSGATTLEAEERESTWEIARFERLSARDFSGAVEPLIQEGLRKVEEIEYRRNLLRKWFYFHCEEVRTAGHVHEVEELKAANRGLEEFIHHRCTEGLLARGDHYYFGVGYLSEENIKDHGCLWDGNIAELKEIIATLEARRDPGAASSELEKDRAREAEIDRKLKEYDYAWSAAYHVLNEGKLTGKAHFEARQQLKDISDKKLILERAKKHRGLLEPKNQYLAPEAR